MKISDFSIRHPAIISIVALAVLVFGVVALRSLNQELIPDASLPTMVVITEYPGVGPAEIEDQVTRVLEDALASISELSRITSASVPSASSISMEFLWETDIDAKLPEVRERISDVLDDLPDGISGPPTIIKVSSGLIPIFTFTISGSVDPYELAEFARDTLVPELAQIPGTATVNLKGAVDRELAVRVDPARLAARGLDVLSVIQVLSAYGNPIPAGTSEYRGDLMSLRTSGTYSSEHELGMVVVGSQGSTPILLRDVATVEMRETDPTFTVLQDGQPTIAIDVTKRPNADSLQIISEARRIMSEATTQFGGALEFTEVRDEGRQIDVAIQHVRNAALLGGMLAVLVLFLFLRRGTATFIIGVSIPFAVVIAFVLLYANRQTLNETTLGGLTVAIGMIVDSSIVILENIYRHFRQKPDDPESAASIGADEVGSAVIASTTTTLAVFVPLLFVSGIAGIMLQDVSLTIVFALFGSLIAAIVIVPFLFTRLTRAAANRRAARDAAAKPETAGRRAEIAARRNERRAARRARQFEEGRVMAGVEKLYARALRGTIDSGVFVVLVAVLLLSLTVNLFSFLGFQFLPDVDNGEIVFTVETPVGSTMEYSRSRARLLQDVVDHYVPEAEATVIYVGQSSNYARTRTESMAYGVIRLKPSDERERGALEIIDALRRETTANVPDTRCGFSVGGINETVAEATGGSGFQVTVRGRELDEVYRAAVAVQSVMEQDPEIVETTVEIDRSYQEITASLDLATLGRLALTPQEAGIAARALFTGIQVADITTAHGSIPVVVTSNLDSEPYTDDVWNSIYLVNHRMELVSFGAFTRTDTDRTFSLIPHVNREPAVQINSTLRGSNVRAVRTRMLAALGDVSFPFGVEWEITGQSAELIDSFTTLLYAVAASIFLVYVVMVIQFERFVQPLIVLSSIPFTMIGVILTLLAFGSTLSVVSFLGIIALAGIVVNNAIVMIDYTNMLRKRYGVPLHEAVIQGASTRLRPILMTTLTTVLGLVPMALGLGEGGEFLAPLGQAIAGGLVTSTAVTLFLVPTLYWIVEHRIERRLEARNRSEV